MIGLTGISYISTHFESRAAHPDERYIFDNRVEMGKNLKTFASPHAFSRGRQNVFCG
ncbi:MAG: hypothetical protein FWF71_02465 [Actinomycetia bacterium]|nr:hypothetical protein [Actinomycetes bacterium]